MIGESSSTATRRVMTSGQRQNSVCAVVLNYVSYDQAIQCVADLLAQDYVGLDIVVVDNHSPNDSLQQLAAAFEAEPRVTIIETPENLGYARGNNFGCEWRLSRGPVDYLVIANSDIRIPSTTALRKLVDFANAIADLGGAGPKVVNSKGFIQGPYRRPDLVTRSLRYLFPAIPYVHNLWKRGRGSQSVPRPCYAIVGAFMLLEASAFLRIDMFDSKTFLGAEEYILSEKFMRIGRRFYYFPQVTVVHNHGGTVVGRTGRSSWNTYQRGVDSMIYYFKEYRKSGPLGIQFYRASSLLYGRVLFPLRKLFM